jgi:glycosyltransferase involved in cell wall biosynthesis
VKVGLITSSYPRWAGDGAGSFVASLARALVAQGLEVHVIAPYDPACVAIEQGGVQVHRFRYAPREALHLAGHGRALQADVRLKRVVPWLMPGFVLAALGTALALHRRERFDLWHGHWAVPGGAIAGAAARLSGRPLVISLHGSDVYVAESNRFYATVARSGLSRARRVIACSEDLRSRAVALGLEEAKSLVIPYGVDMARYTGGDGAVWRARLGIPGEALVVGALGRLVHKKGFGHLIAAWPQIQAALPQAYGIIGGAGDLRNDLTAQAARLGLAERVLFPGHIPWDETAPFYAACDAVAVPSVVDAQGNVDGLPNVLLEAMASGRAVVASRVAGIPAVVEEGVNGLLVPPGDETALAAALVCLLTNAPLRQRLGEQARAAMARSYDWAAIAMRTATVYDAALGRGGTP